MENFRPNRRDLLKGAIASAFAGMKGSAAEAQTRRNERVRELEENGLYLSIKAFNKIPGNALVLCANNEEYLKVMESIRSRDAMRSQKGKFKFDIVQRGACVEVSGDIRNYDDGVDTNTFNNRAMHVLNAAAPFAESYLGRLKSSGQAKFSLVQLRGHTNDMRPLFDRSKEYQSDACFLTMGGCESTPFIQEFHKPERPVSGEKHIGQTVNNTQLLVRFFDELGSGKHASWQNFYSSIAATSSTVAGGRVIVPGDPNYRSFL